MGAPPMTIIHLNLINFTHHEALSDIFDKYTNDFEFTTNEVFRRVVPPKCPECGTRMVHNGSSIHTKKGLGSVKMDRYYCTSCRKSVEEDHDFWDKMKSEFSGGSIPEGRIAGRSDNLL